MKIPANINFSVNKEIIDILLMDKTANHAGNILLFNNNYQRYGYNYNDQITLDLINEIEPRALKMNNVQKERTILKAEIFTPFWIVKKQNSAVEQYFINENLTDYISKTWMEAACGEAPYMTTRYDMANGEIIPVSQRAGFVDKKLRRISLEIDDKNQWRSLAACAIKSSYGFELSGDSLFIARMNMLYNYIEHYIDKWKEQPEINDLKSIAEIISHNVFQMDWLNTDNFKNKFNVIVGNPPYQMKDGGAQASAKPVYHLFIQKAKALRPDYISMITPSRWFAGGKGLSEFRDEMLNDLSIKQLHDYPNASECFSDAEIKGGVNYFIWDKSHNGKCRVCSYKDNELISESERFLKNDNCDIFIRYNEAISILEKIKIKNETSFSELVSSRNPFGLATNYQFSGIISGDNLIKLYENKKIEYVPENEILKNQDWINQHKIFIPYAFGKGNSQTDKIRAFYAGFNTACTETYLVIGPFPNKEICENVIGYMNTKFFRFMLNLMKNTQHASKRVYSYIPRQDFSKQWTDDELFEKYNLTATEIDCIEKEIPVKDNVEYSPMPMV